MEEVIVRFVGHLTRTSLAEAFGTAPTDIERFDLVVDCLEMTGYDLDSRHAFIDWNRTNKARVRRVAILTEKTIWHMVIRAMALASGQTMKPFDTLDGARQWLAADK